MNHFHVLLPGAKITDIWVFTHKYNLDCFFIIFIWVNTQKAANVRHCDQDLHCSLIESLKSIYYVCDQYSLRSDCTDVQSDLNLH